MKPVEDAAEGIHLEPIHVLLADMPEVLAQLIAQVVEQQGDMQLVGRVEGAVETLAAASAADVAIVGVGLIEPLPAICSHLLHEYPHLRILALSTHSDEIACYWLGLRRQRLRGGSAEQVLRSIRYIYGLDSMA